MAPRGPAFIFHLHRIKRRPAAGGPAGGLPMMRSIARITLVNWLLQREAIEDEISHP
jgi:hypothetical protein